MNTFVHRGHRLTYSNTGALIAASAVVVLASGATGMIGVAVTDIAATTGTGEVEVEGVHELTKVAGQAFTLGQLLYWDAGNSRLTSTASGNTRAGRCAQAAASAAVLARVKLNAA